MQQTGCDKQKNMFPMYMCQFLPYAGGDLANVGGGGHYIVPDKGLNGIIIIRKDVYDYQAFE
jgi:hypothetical protein